MKALDFIDSPVPSMRLFNVCRAKTGGWNDDAGCAGTCGLAYPSKMWFQPDKKRWKWVCKVDWSALTTAAERQPTEKLTAWVRELTEKYGDDCTKWPSIGCGANFKPWAKGHSMVVEIMLKDGSWTAFISDRIPEELDDAIKGKHAEFHNAMNGMSPEELQALIPMDFPMRHIMEDFPMVAKYPIDAWEKMNSPYMSVRSWAKLCIRVAEKNLTSLQNIMEVARKFDTDAFESIE